jgi:hypothetical protein
MDATDKHVIKTALKTLNAAGGIGVSKAALLSQIELAAGTPVTGEQLESAFQMLRDRGWMDCHFEPIWHTQRFTLTERGLTALEGM